MKRAIILFWKGLTGILIAIANWFTVILGMKGESKYARIIRHITGGSFAFIMLILAFAIGLDFIENIYYRTNADRDCYKPDYDSRYLSRNATYYSRAYENDGYVETRDGRKTIKGIHWIAKPLGGDSLVCYSNGKTRGYFNMLTGEVAIKPQYAHAWIFSGGLASVDDNGWIKFINSKGDIVIDPEIPYLTGADGYVFRNKHCVVHNDRRDRYGMIDKQGKWVLKAEYESIQPADTFWVVCKEGEQSLLTDNMKTVMPFMKATLRVSDGRITATMDNHTLRKYNLQGELVEDFLISSVDGMTYASEELRYTTAKSYDEAGNLIGEVEDAEPVPVQKSANCKRYEAESGWYGLMSPDGNIITPPAYRDITAIGYDLYLCKKDFYCGEVLNGKGIRVK